MSEIKSYETKSISYEVALAGEDPQWGRILRAHQHGDGLQIYALELCGVEDSVYLGDLDWWITKLTELRNKIDEDYGAGLAEALK